MATASDDFTRSASETPAAAPWLSANAVGDIIGGANIDGTFDYLWASGGSVRISLYDGSISWGNDQTVDAVVGALGSGSHYAILVARFTVGGNGYAVDTDGPNTVIYRVTGGVFTTLKTSTTTFANGDTMGIRTAGDTIHLRKNGADVDSTTDSTYPTGGRPGAGAFGNATIDNWSATDGAGAGPELSGNATMPAPDAAGGLSGGTASTITGDAVMPGPAAAGGLEGGTSSALSGGATLPGPSASGGLASGSGTFTSDVLERNNGAAVGVVSLDYVSIHNPATGALVVLKTGVSTNAGGVFAVADPLLVPGTSYLAVWRESTGQRGWGVATAT